MRKLLFTRYLAAEIIEEFKHLDVNDIAEFCHLNIEETTKLKESLS